tara:strand:- start:2536 stop:3021 length:486 start_codon:yes stop_codon:yes gene_type:complete
MLCFKKQYIILGIFLITLSCNSVPLYTTKLTENLINDKITVEEINGEVGFYLSQKLRLSLNDAGHKKPIRLSTELTLTNNEYGLSSSNQVTRKDLIGTINCKLTKNDHEHNFIITERVSFDINQSNVANKAAEQNAKKRLSTLLSKRILTELYHSNLAWIK